MRHISIPLSLLRKDCQMKKRVIITSILTIALCVCLIAGSTFALFTAEKRVSITVASAGVSVEAYLVETVETWSMEIEQLDGTWANGGAVTAKGGELQLSNMSPGDKVRAKVVVTNDSTIAIQYRVVITVTSDEGLVDVLDFTIDGLQADAQSTVYGKWKNLSPNSEKIEIPILIYMPVEVTSQYASKDATVQLTVEAVQNNASLNYTTITGESEFTLPGDLALYDKQFIDTKGATGAVTVDGDGYTVTHHATAYENLVENYFSSANGSDITVNDLTIAGDMAANFLGHYQGATYNTYNTTLNNVNIIDLKAATYLVDKNLGAALFVYGNATLNNCNIYGTTRSSLDELEGTLYDLAVVNYTTTNINGGKYGSIYTWEQCKLTVKDAEVDTIYCNTNRKSDNENGLTVGSGATVTNLIVTPHAATGLHTNVTIEAGATVETLTLNGTFDRNDSIEIKDGATVNSIVWNEITYDSVEAFQAAFANR